MEKPALPRPDMTKLAAPSSVARARLVTTFFACALAIVWFVFASRRGREELYNPGPLVAAHAMFENNCAACHDGNGHGGFFRTVSDTACLKCHDGAIHHPNQIMKEPGVTKVVLAMAVTDSSHAFGMRSSDCASCHVEHRGHAALISASDNNCTNCHADLKAHATHPEQIVSANSVTAFSLGSHPAFGQQLQKDGKPFDPTVLKFDHKYHLTQVPALAAVANKCALCHSATPVDPAAHKPTGTDADVPPWLGPKDNPSVADVGNRRYMQPISFERSCAQCHQMNLPGTTPVAIPHQDMPIVRGQIAALPQIYAAAIAVDPKKADKLNDGTKRKPHMMSEQDYVKQQLAKLQQTVNAAQTAHPLAADSIEHYVAYEAANSCNKCHSVEGSLPSEVLAAPKGSTVQLLSTVPTGIPETTRRWFTHSSFDHYAHRDQSCLSCHSDVMNSIVPDDRALKSSDPAQWAEIQLSETHRLLQPGITSCVACHHIDTGSGHGASSSCITCHDFHDRTKERPAAN